MAELKKSFSKTTLGLAIFIFIIILGMPFVYAQSIPITISSSMDDVIFDGAWTFTAEWKQSSITEIPSESGLIYLRSAHQGNFIYILIDVVPDITIDNNEDFAIVCFDAKNEKNSKPDENDYCFKIKLGSDKVVTLQGKQSEGFVVVKNHADLIGVGGVSVDRYSQEPHAAYEFKIPIELLERTDVYGFYAEVFDYSKSQTFTWPSEINPENSEIPSPAKWGIIYSPDKSLPEYELPVLVLIVGTLGVILLSSRYKQNLFYLNR